VNAHEPADTRVAEMANVIRHSGYPAYCTAETLAERLLFLLEQFEDPLTSAEEVQRSSTTEENS
jgi:hypothetical protein